MARRGRCEGCERPLATCWCAFARPVQSPHRLVVLQHPREVHAPFGTVRILRRVLPDVHVRVGIDHAHDAELAALCSDAARPPLLLYPRQDALPLQPGAVSGPRTLVVLDGTWSQARSLFAANPPVQKLPRYALALARPSIYTLRRQPKEGCLSTVEAVAEALAILHGDPGVRDALLAPLEAMIGLQWACYDAGTSSVLAERGLLERAGYLPRRR